MKKGSFVISAFVIVIPFFVKGGYELHDNYENSMANTKVICCNSREAEKF